MKGKRPEFLIIAGAPRCGTSSLFSNLAMHAQICPSRVKETGFFYPAAAPLRKWLPFEQGIEAYRGLFASDRGPETVRCEATANYIYFPEVARRIRDLLPDARVVLVLREPIARLVSEYRYAILAGVIDHRCSFGQYIKAQSAPGIGGTDGPSHLRALNNGLYSRFLPAYYEALGKERVLVVWFESLKSEPRATLRRIGEFAGLNAPHFDTVPLHTSNESVTVTRPRLFDLIRRLERAHLHVLATNTRMSLKHRMYRRASSILLRIATAPSQPIEMTEDVRNFLDSYYRSEADRIAALVGEQPPWRGRRPSPERVVQSTEQATPL